MFDRVHAVHVYFPYMQTLAREQHPPPTPALHNAIGCYLQPQSLTRFDRITYVICSLHADLDEGAAPTPTTALEPAVNGDAAAAAAANGSSHEGGATEAAAAAAAAAEETAAAAAAEAAEAASFFQQRDGEAPLAYAVRVFERVYRHDIEKVLSMEVRLPDALGVTFVCLRRRAGVCCAGV
jgi:hypothetical protein